MFAVLYEQCYINKIPKNDRRERMRSTERERLKLQLSTVDETSVLIISNKLFLPEIILQNVKACKTTIKLFLIKLHQCHFFRLKTKENLWPLQYML